MWQGLRSIKGVSFWVQFLAGVVSVMVAIAVTIYFLVLFGDNLTPVPLVVDGTQAGFTSELCPGARVITSYQASVSDPLVVEIFYVVMDREREYTHTEVPLGHTFAPYSEPANFRQPLAWTVPNLPGGNYTFAISLWMRGIGADPVNIYVPFTIAAACPSNEVEGQ